MELRLCYSCGLLFNAQFQPDVLRYDTSYDNSLDFSPAFQSYAKSLAQRLVDDHSLSRKRIVEIGCGNGEFLKLLCRSGDNVGTGYDPRQPASEPAADVTIVKDYFSVAKHQSSFDFLCCRHVLEHIENPLKFLLALAKMNSASPGAVFYFEVPNGDLVLNAYGVWDIIYPHVSYFTERSLSGLFQKAGFEVRRVGTTFSNQFLFVEAQLPFPGDACASGPMHAVPNSLLAAGERFENHFLSAIRDWSELLARLTQARRRVAFWGVGAKGVTFLNLVAGAANICSVIDANPRKQYMFVPGTGQIISNPETLNQLSPEVVILLNPAYRQEITARLASFDIAATILTRPNQEAIN